MLLWTESCSTTEGATNCKVLLPAVVVGWRFARRNTTTPCNKTARRQGDTAVGVFVGWFGVFGTTVTKSKAMASTELSCTHSRDCIIKLVHVLHATFKVYSRINWLFWKYKITVCKTILYSPVFFLRRRVLDTFQLVHTFAR